MKTLTLILATLALGLLPAQVSGGPRGYNLLIAGGSEPNQIRISVTADGRSYVIESRVPLEVGAGLCASDPATPTRLVCEARRISGFEVNAGEGDDWVKIAADIPVPATVRGGGGADLLIGGGGNDKLIGGRGADDLRGRGGDDVLLGGPGRDRLRGGGGRDVCDGGPGRDAASSCEIRRRLG